MKRSFFPFFITFFGVFLLDQLSKAAAMGQGRVTINQGVSFGVGGALLRQGYAGHSGGVVLFSIVSVVVLIGIYIGAKKIWQKNLWVYGGLSAAALSNVWDRVMYGGVRDFLWVPVLHVQNNLADWVIVGCLAWWGWRVVVSGTVNSE